MTLWRNLELKEHGQDTGLILYPLHMVPDLSADPAFVPTRITAFGTVRRFPKWYIYPYVASTSASDILPCATRLRSLTALPLPLLRDGGVAPPVSSCVHASSLQAIAATKVDDYIILDTIIS